MAACGKRRFALFGGLLLACGAPSGGAPSGGRELTREEIPVLEPGWDIPIVDESALPEPAPEAGFIALEKTAYQARLEGDREFTSEPARLFYNFVPAETGAKEKPVIVLFNGGPGAPATLLRCFGTGPNSLDAEDLSAPPAPNPYRFTRFGSLLYIDPRFSGFSYGVTEHPESDAEREQAFREDSLNPTRDAADFAQVILRVLNKIPAIRNNPVVLVGESYGGTRAALMLDILTDLGDDFSIYVNQAWKAELDEHFASVFARPERANRASRAKQFGWQILIQPLLFGAAQYDKMGDFSQRLYRDPAGPCRYHVGRTGAWCEELERAATRTMVDPKSFETIVGVSPQRVPGLAASDRDGAFRGARSEATSETGFEELLGGLPTWDAYYTDQISVALGNLTRTTEIYSYVHTALRSLTQTQTLITNALMDGVIESSSILEVLASMDGIQIESVAMPSTAQADTISPADRPVDRLYTVRYPAADQTREFTLFFPVYPDSGHAVTVSQPDKFFADVQHFLASTGLGR
ncbi:MAG TPA: hypothetical protein VFQ61_01875 [Polyangiaceae bacterium]|nr:hypothetical protein [Polyangiaceae bacterium]